VQVAFFTGFGIADFQSFHMVVAKDICYLCVPVNVDLGLLNTVLHGFTCPHLLPAPAYAPESRTWSGKLILPLRNHPANHS